MSFTVAFNYIFYRWIRVEYRRFVFILLYTYTLHVLLPMRYSWYIHDLFDPKFAVFFEIIACDLNGLSFYPFCSRTGILFVHNLLLGYQRLSRATCCLVPTLAEHAAGLSHETLVRSPSSAPVQQIWYNKIIQNKS